ncbi:MAG TPA: ATP-binding protein [Methylococcaceae bacterium]|nr:ATP-binding protein [Methylococcaceae bacterium]
MAPNEPAPTAGPAELRDAFFQFNQLSRTLIDSYQELEAQVGRLNAELQAAREARLQTLLEKEQLANRLQHLLAALPGAVVVLDDAGAIADCNPVAENWLGGPLRGSGWREVSERNFLADTGNPHQRRLRDGRDVGLSVSALGPEHGQIILLTDISELRALQDLVSQQQRLTAMGEMLASLAHQVRTPLSAALLYASQLDAAELPVAQRQKFSRRLLERLRHIERQIHDMLVFARAGRFALESVSVARLLERAGTAAEALFRAGEARLAVDDDAPGALLRVNEEALLGALTNLLANAAEAAGGAGRITLRVSRPRPGAVRFSVSDNGPGMTEAVRARVFEPFFTTRPGGTGLGLAVVEHIARSHGGEAWCESAPGQGATFHMLVPEAGADQALPAGVQGEALHD